MELARFKRLCAPGTEVTICRKTGDMATVVRTVKRQTSTDLILHREGDNEGFFPWRKASNWEFTENEGSITGMVYEDLKTPSEKRKAIASITLKKESNE